MASSAIEHRPGPVEVAPLELEPTEPEALDALERLRRGTAETESPQGLADPRRRA